MNILINLSTLKKGGGQNVAMNFLIGLSKSDTNNINLLFIVARNSEPHLFLQNKRTYKFYIAPENPIARIIFEILNGKKIIRENSINIIYTYFGYSLFPRRIPQVSGSADSNIYFPEIDFWSSYKGISRFKKKIIDKYRIWGVKRSSAVIFENEAMMQRGKELLGLNNVKYIKPSYTASESQSKLTLPIKNNKPKGLFLCGWQLNKNILFIPNIASELRKKNIEFQFILTAPDDGSEIQKQFFDLVEKFDVADMVSVVGQVKKEQLYNLYSQIDFVFLLSKLESFSNNIIEAWHYNKPLIISSELWAKSICKNAALYVERDNANSIAEAISHLLIDKDHQSLLIEKGRIELKNYPKIEERIKNEINYLKYVQKIS